MYTYILVVYLCQFYVVSGTFFIFCAIVCIHSTWHVILFVSIRGLCYYLYVFCKICAIVCMYAFTSFALLHVYNGKCILSTWSPRRCFVFTSVLGDYIAHYALSQGANYIHI